MFYFVTYWEISVAMALGWIVKVGTLTKHGSIESTKWVAHSAPFALREAAEDYAALVRKLEPHHHKVEVFPT